MFLILQVGMGRVQCGPSDVDSIRAGRACLLVNMSYLSFAQIPSQGTVVVIVHDAIMVMQWLVFNYIRTYLYSSSASISAH
jgi:hypothetical protein